MIRTLAIVIGISTIRVVDLGLFAAFQTTPRVVFGPSLWIGWGLTAAVAEIWVRRTRSPRATGPGLEAPITTASV